MRKCFIKVIAAAASCILWATPAYAQETSPPPIKSKDYYENIYIACEDNLLTARDARTKEVRFFAEVINDSVVVNSEAVNLRSNPNIHAPIVTILSAGTTLHRIAATEIGWDIIMYNERVCYIWDEYTSKPADIKISPSFGDIRLMSAIIFSEAGNQCLAGKQAVGIIVMNRVKSDKFPNNINDVIYQRGQFSPATNGSLNRSLSMYDKGTLPQECIDAATYALSGNTLVSYNNVTYNMYDFLFFSQYVSGCRLKIQDHMFK